jgi:hypothetical protein
MYQIKSDTISLSILSALSALGLAAGCSKKDEAAPGANEAPRAAAVVETPKASPAPAAGNDAPVPEKLRDGEYAKLGMLLGSWKGQGTLSMGGQDMAVRSTFECEVARGGIGLDCVHDGQIEGVGPLIEDALIGIDPATGDLHWYNINTMGEAHDHVGHWAGDSRIEWEVEGQADGKPMVETISMDIEGNALSFRSETRVDGQQAALFVGTMEK